LLVVVVAGAAGLYVGDAVELCLYFAIAVADDAVGGHAISEWREAFLFPSFFHITNAAGDGPRGVAVHDIAVTGSGDEVFCCL